LRGSRADDEPLFVMIGTTPARRRWTGLSFAMALLRLELTAILAGAATLVAAGAHAQAPAPPPQSDCAGAGSVSGEVASVIDGRSFRLVDGREIRLAGVEPPPLTAAGEGQAGLAAKTALEALTLRRPVVVQPAAPGPDRYGRLVAYAFVTAADREGFVQHAMLAGGHALLSPFGITPACRSVLRAAEHAARAARLGLWADSDYGVRQADDPADVLSRQGRFALVGGKVASVRESGGIVYVNFGRHWLEDFTVTILKRNERLFTGAGMAPNKLAGRRVEVRGWIEQRNGPAIEVTRPEQIELVD
jgi:endonuclease YncB( thermonuclease family)